MEKNDQKYLGRMLEAAQDAMEFMKGRTRDDLNEDKQLTLSLVKSLEMLASSAEKVSKACRSDCKPIPWVEVIEIKQQVVHTYWEIDRDWLWEKMTVDLPEIINALEVLLKDK
jgi:uncharacterized protein with HEPN domain